MIYRVNISRLIWLILLVLVVSILSCGRNKQLIPEEMAHYEIPKAALQEKSKAFDILAVLMGEYQEDIGFIGKIWIRAKVKNNTKYSFKQPVSLFIAVKDYKVIQNEIGNRWPDRGALLICPSILSSPWQPDEIIDVTSEIDLNPEGYQDYEWRFFEYLTKTLRLPANEPVKIDEYVSTFYGMAGLFPVDCFRENCPYKKLPKDDPLYCGQRKGRE